MCLVENYLIAARGRGIPSVSTELLLVGVPVGGAREAQERSTSNLVRCLGWRKSLYIL